MTAPSTVAPVPAREDEAPATALVPVAPAAPPAELVERLEEHARDARGAMARGTERALRADSAVFSGWCAAAGRAHLPASPETVAAFVDAMGEERAPVTVRRYVSSIATLHRAAGALGGRWIGPCPTPPPPRAAAVTSRSRDS